MIDNRTDTRREGCYEKFSPDTDSLVNYHYADLTKGRYATTAAHWHEHLELLCVRQGVLHIFVQGKKLEAVPGDIIVINSGELHAIPEKDDETTYECLIPKKSLCDRMAIPIESIVVANHIRNERYTALFQQIMTELREMPPFYKLSVPVHLLDLVINLFREYQVSNDTLSATPLTPPSKKYIIKKAIDYIQKNYSQPISTKEICEYLGFDRSYICNNFKKITGTTIIEYLNMVRCEYARDLLRRGSIGVTECAEQCGFHHMSYFTKTYKHYIGELPSETIKKHISSTSV